MIEKLNNYYLGCGGFGDLLLTMSTFYDEIEKNDIVWFADNKKFIEEALNIFPKFQNKIVFTKDNTFSSKWFKFANHEKCQGTGITPKNLDYSEWKDVNIFEKYKVNSFPKFAQAFSLPSNLIYLDFVLGKPEWILHDDGTFDIYDDPSAVAITTAKAHSGSKSVFYNPNAPGADATNSPVIYLPDLNTVYLSFWWWIPSSLEGGEGGQHFFRFGS